MFKRPLPILLASFSLLTALMACNLPGSKPTPDTSGTATFAAILTKVAGTAQAAPSATLSAGQTPLPTALPTVVVVKPSPSPAATSTQGAQGCNDGAEFVADVTIPDNTVLQPGAAFLKTWRLKNSGTCTWVGSYALVFMSGAQMGAVANVSISGNVTPGSQYDVSVNMVAPAAPGTYVGRWQLRNSANQVFGAIPYVQIIVPGATGTPVTPTATRTITSTPQSGTPTATAVGGCADNAEFVADVTIPDNTVIAPGAVFVKTWRMKNTGTCTWVSAYAYAFTSDNPLGAPAAVNIVGNVAPGSLYDVSVSFTAPITPGVYLSRWRMRNAANTLFGPTPYVQIMVSGTPATATPTPTSQTTALPTPTATATATTPPALNFTASFAESWVCGNATYVSFQIENTGSLPLESVQFALEGPIGVPLVTNLSNTPFKTSSQEPEPGCVRNGQETLAPTGRAWVYAPLTYLPLDTLGRALFKICSQNDFAGVCHQATVEFTFR